jgi:hypothetical protein
VRLILSLAVLACLFAPGARAQDATAGALDKLSLDALTSAPAPGAAAAWSAAHPSRSSRHASVQRASAYGYASSRPVWHASRHYAAVSHHRGYYAAAPRHHSYYAAVSRHHGNYAAVSHHRSFYAAAPRRSYTVAYHHGAAPRRHGYTMASWSHASWHRPQPRFVAAWTRVPSHVTAHHVHHVSYAPAHRRSRHR